MVRKGANVIEQDQIPGQKVVWIKIEIMEEIILNRGKIFSNLMPISYFRFWEFSVRSHHSWLRTKKSCS